MISLKKKPINPNCGKLSDAQRTLDYRMIYDKNIGTKENIDNIGDIKVLYLCQKSTGKTMAEVSIYIDIEFRNKGYGGKAFELYVNHIFTNSDIDLLENWILAGNKNTPSLRIHEKLGFKQCICDGLLCYRITKEEFFNCKKERDFIKANLCLDGFGEKIEELFI